MIFIFNKKSYDGDGEYIGRGINSVLGNPFSHLPNTKAQFKVSSREEAVESYRLWITEKLKSDNEVKKEVLRLVEKYKKEKCLILICWCSPALCHGEVLRDIIKDMSNIN